MILVLCVTTETYDPSYCIKSWKSGGKRALKKFIKDETTVVGSNDRCPDCGEKLIFQDSCVLCPNCGYSKCR